MKTPWRTPPALLSIADADNLNYMLTLPVEDAAKIDGAASLSHMMNANTFTCGAFHVTSKDDVETVARTCGTPSSLSSGCAASLTSW